MNNFKTILSGASLRAALLAAGVLAGALAGTVQAQPASPVGDWDFVLTGAEQGVGFLEFSADFTLHGWEVVTHRQTPFSSQSTLGTSRDDFGVGRTTGSRTGTTNVTLFFFGYTPLFGSWSVAPNGKVIGVLGQNDTNFPDGFSFTGKLRPGGSFVLNAIESPGATALDHRIRHVTWSGSPLSAQTDIGGTWVAQGSLTGSSTNGSSTQSFTELLTLTSLSSGDPTGALTDLAASPFAAQSYVITGVGPGYTNVGVALQSSRKRLSVLLQYGDASSSTNLLLRVVEGPLNTNKFIANPLAGTDQDLDIVRYRMQRATNAPPAF